MSRVMAYHLSAGIAKQRLTIRGFKNSETMHRFLNTGSNSLTWRPCEARYQYFGIEGKTEPYKGMKPGVYARAGGQWHNVKTIDPSILVHI